VESKIDYSKIAKPLELETNILIGRELKPSGFKGFV
jgi:hypothetical protein